MQLVVTGTGELRCLYSEVIELPALGAVHIRRGSYLDADEHGRWYADLCPVNGPRLGPFKDRSSGLTAEQEWLDLNWLGKVPSLPS